jgi:hypothetical protein
MGAVKVAFMFVFLRKERYSQNNAKFAPEKNALEGHPYAQTHFSQHN